MSPKLAVAVGVLIIFAAAIAAAEVIDGGRAEDAPTAKQPKGGADKPKTKKEKPQQLPPATGGTQPGEGGVEPLQPGAEASWEQFAASMPSEIGVAVVGVGSGAAPKAFGPLQSGHAWSSIKVPILVTLLGEREAQGTGLDGEEKELARSALTASDNAAAASLFSRLEATNGGLEGASRAVSETLSRGSETFTEVATAPPPSGASSTYGQTEWSLPASAEFFAALDQGCLIGPEGTGEVLGLMSEVVPEQQWGLAVGGFSGAVAYKAGWGPEGSASGPYLVRQSGVVVGNDGGAVSVAMAAIDGSGSFEGGVGVLGRIAEWVAENLKSPIPVGTSSC